MAGGPPASPDPDWLAHGLGYQSQPGDRTLIRRIRRTFPSLEVRNFRYWFYGQGVSLSGTWMQSVALAWLVLELTGNGVALGIVAAAEFLPVLLLSPWGGLAADRYDKRWLLVGSQVVGAAVALILGILTLAGVVTPWMVYLAAGAMGCVRAVETPTRHTFVLEMVGGQHLTNAVTFNSILTNAARVIGPGLAGLIIAAGGPGICFVVNSATYVAVIVALGLMNSHELTPAQPAAREPRQLREGLTYVRGVPGLFIPLTVMLVIGVLSLEWRVSLPLFAERSLKGGADAYGMLLASMGVGAILGGLIVATRAVPGPRSLMRAGTALGVGILALAAAPNLPLALAAIVPVGIAFIWFLTAANTTLQLTAKPEYRGRIMSLYTVTLLGSTPIGGPVIGWIGEHVGARAALAVGGVAAIAACAWGRWKLNRKGVPEVLPTVGRSAPATGHAQPLGRQRTTKVPPDDGLVGGP